MYIISLLLKSDYCLLVQILANVTVDIPNLVELHVIGSIE